MERVFPNLRFISPVAMLQAPGDRTRWFVVEQGGEVRVFENNPTVTVGSSFINIRTRVSAGGELEIEWLDDQGNPDTAVSLAKDVIGKGTQIIAGTVVSGIATALAEQAAQNKVLYISGPAATDAITDPRTCELTLTALQPGATVEAVREATGWNLAVADHVDVVPPPTAEELGVLRELQATLAPAGTDRGTAA